MPPPRPALGALREVLPGLAAVYLFGSAAAGADSDVDLAVLAAAPLDPVARFDLQERLAARLGRDVDLVDLRAASTVLRAQVFASARVALDADRRDRAVPRPRPRGVRRDPASLDDPTRQGSIVLNLQRAAQAAIGLALHLVRRRALGLPQQSRDAFRLLADGGGLPADLAQAMMRMVGFRNMAVHDYLTPHPAVVRTIGSGRLRGLEAFAAWAAREAAG